MHENTQKCAPTFQIFEAREEQGGEIARMVLFRQARARECSLTFQDPGCKAGALQM